MQERIVIDPEIQHGKPVIRGTRVPITRIVGGLAGGMTKEEVMREYEVTEEDVAAALSCAAELIEAEEFHPLPFSAEYGYAVSDYASESERPESAMEVQLCCRTT
jgi:uncharacterized protein (DUF433 family)